MRSNVIRLACMLAICSLASFSLAQNGAATKAPARPAARGAKDAQPAAGQPAPRTAARGNQPAGNAAPAVPGAAAARPGPRPPFELTESQQQLLDQILLRWETQSDKVKTFKCGFRRWEYNPTFGPEKFEYLMSESRGDIKYAAPDRGEFHVTEFKEYENAKKDYVVRTEGLEHWVCNGKAIFEFNRAKQRLIERPLPPDLQGKAISEGPLPFIFGAKADQLKRRYWMRDVTPKEQIGKEIWLEAVPKFQQDAANFQRATVILAEPDFMPAALQIIPPGAANKNPKAQPANTAYQFVEGKVNNWAGTWDFTAPRLTPAMIVQGWKHVIEKPEGEEPPATPSAPVETPKQAKRGAAAPPRK
jgi:TIGR03009 family protein